MEGAREVTEDDTGHLDGLRKINVKFSLDAPAELSYEFLVAVFGRWRLEDGEEIIDLADYLHVPEGPACLLVSQRWHFGIDLAGGKPGILLSNRGKLGGEPAARIAAVIRTCLEKGKRLLGESDVPSSVRPALPDLELVVNDRVLAENTDEADAVMRPGLTATLDRLYGKDAYSVEREKDPTRRLGYLVKATTENDLTFDELLGRLG